VYSCLVACTGSDPALQNWRREFASTSLHSTSTAHNGVLLERFATRFAWLPPMALGLRLKPVDGGRGGFEHEPVASWVAGVRVPRWLPPAVGAVGTAGPESHYRAELARMPEITKDLPSNGAGWYVKTTASAPLVGKLVSYEGVLHPKSKPVQ
jgi:hypothetical protein